MHSEDRPRFSGDDAGEGADRAPSPGAGSGDDDVVAAAEEANDDEVVDAEIVDEKD